MPKLPKLSETSLGRGVVAGLAAVVFTLVAISLFADIGLTKGHNRTVLAILFGAWLIGPPLWFLREWSVFEPDQNDPKKFEYFKYSHELAKNFWIAVSVFLGLLLGFM